MTYDPSVFRDALRECEAAQVRAGAPILCAAARELAFAVVEGSLDVKVARTALYEACLLYNVPIEGPGAAFHESRKFFRGELNEVGERFVTFPDRVKALIEKFWGPNPDPTSPKPWGPKP